MSKFSVKKPLTVLVGVIIIIVLGIVSLTRMTPDLLPNIDMNYAMIMTSYVGATPEEVEAQVTKPLEQAFSTLEDIKGVTSTSSENYSLVVLEFEEDTNLDARTVDMLQSITQLEGNWDDKVGTPIIMKLNPSMMPVMVSAVSYKGKDIKDLSTVLDGEILSKLEGTSGVASITSVGVLEEQINVVLSQEKITAIKEAVTKMLTATLGADMAQQTVSSMKLDETLSMDTINKLLTAQNFSMPAGYVTQDGVDYLVKVGDDIGSVEDLQNLMIMDLGVGEAGQIRLKDVADVYISDNADSLFATVNGTDGVLLTFSKQSSYATAEVAENISNKIADLEDEYDGLDFITMMDQGEYIDMVVNSILQNILLGSLFAVIILFLFLKDIKPTIIILFSIPISVLTAITLMYFTGITINMISLSGLAVAIGMLVDNSVVVIENIYRLRSKGVSAIKAAVTGATQVAGAIASSTLTTICVFLPIVFVDGLTRQLFVDMALTLAYALLASLLVALTLVPAMSSRILKEYKPRTHKLFDKMMNGYEKTIRFALKRKILVLLASVALLVLSVVWALSKGFTFMPSFDMPQLQLELKMADDSTLKESKDITNKVLEQVSTIDEVNDYGAMLTSSANSMGMTSTTDTSSVSVYVILDENKDRANSEIIDEIMDKCKDIDCEIVDSTESSMSALTGSGISINVFGDDLTTLQKSANEIADILSKVEGTENVFNGIEDTSPEVKFTVNKDAATAQGLTVAQVYAAISEAMKTETSSTTISTDSKDYDTIIISGNSDDITADYVKSMKINITTMSGETKNIPISDVAEITDTETLTSIARDNQRRCITVTADIKDNYNVTLVTNDFKDALKDYNEPSGITYSLAGENENIMDAMKDLVLMLALAILLIYLIMVAQFQSLKSPFIVMFTIPLAVTGGLLALLITGNEISVIAMIGFVMLCGIIVNNGIVLVDYINKLREDGIEKKEAIVDACKTRVRPILMTSLTTILGLIVMVFSDSAGTSIIQPIAIVCVGGLIYATLLTLYVVPSMYDIFNKKDIKVIAKEELEIYKED